MLSLRCFVVATSHAAIISIKADEKDTVNILKKKIKENEDYVIGEKDEFTIWKISVPKEDFPKKAGSVSHHAPYRLSVKELLGGEELRNSEARIKEIFPKIDKDHFNVAIQIQPVPNNNVHVFVDDSNLFIEGKHTVGKIEKLGRVSSRGRQQLNELRIDHDRLLNIVLNGRPKGNKPVLVGSNPQNDSLSLWDVIKKNGEYEVNAPNRNAKNREKGVDPTLGRAIENAVMSHLPGILILVAGDGDYYPHIMSALERNWKVEIWFWEEGTAKILTKAIFESNEVKHCKLDEHYKYFSYGKGLPRFGSSKLVSLTLKGKVIKEWKNKDVFECFKALRVFGWLKWENEHTVNLYFKKVGSLNNAITWIKNKWGSEIKTIEMWENV